MLLLFSIICTCLDLSIFTNFNVHHCFVHLIVSAFYFPLPGAYIYTHTQTYTHIYVYIYVYMYIGILVLSLSKSRKFAQSSAKFALILPILFYDIYKVQKFQINSYFPQHFEDIPFSFGLNQFCLAVHSWCICCFFIGNVFSFWWIFNILNFSMGFSSFITRLRYVVYFLCILLDAS